METQGFQAVIVGAGRLGLAIATLMPKSRIKVAALSTRSGAKTDLQSRFPESEWLTFNSERPESANRIIELARSLIGKSGKVLLFLTVNDDELANVVSTLAPPLRGASNLVVFSCSGGKSLEVLAPFLSHQTEGGILHPCTAVYSDNRTLPLDGTVTYTWSGTSGATPVARELVSSWGGEFVELGEINRVAYHAANVLSAGHLLTLIESSRKLLTSAGVSQDATTQILRSLVTSVLRAVEETNPGVSFASKLTGPFIRGDEKLIEEHLKVIASLAPELSEIYRQIGILATRISEK